MKKIDFGIYGRPLYITLLCIFSTVLFSNNILSKDLNTGATVAVVGKTGVTNYDILSRLRMEALFGKGDLDAGKFQAAYQKKRYIETAEALVNEARQNQATERLATMAKNMHQSKAGFFLRPSEIKKAVEERMNMFAKNNNMSLDKLKNLLGSSYVSFYKQQQARVAFQQFLLAKWGYLIRKKISVQAVEKERKKWKKMQGAKQYFIREIVIYDRGSENRAKEKISEVLTMFNNGQNFLQLVELFSENGLSREKGGMREPQTLEYFEPPVQAFLKHAQDGDISTPIPLPTAGNPKKWILVLLIGTNAAVGVDSAGTNGAGANGARKEPNDDFFRDRLFGIEMDRLASEELANLARMYPCTINIPKDLNLGGVLAPREPAPSDTDEVAVDSGGEVGD
jgi:hypothetical protein